MHMEIGIENPLAITMHGKDFLKRVMQSRGWLYAILGRILEPLGQLHGLPFAAAVINRPLRYESCAVVF